MGRRDILLTDRKLQDLNPLIAGEEDCLPGHSFGPAVRQYTLIHYVLRGKGTFYARGGVHPVHAGQAFVILPDEITTYTADLDDPWHYRWIGFDGNMCRWFSKLPPVLTLPETLFSRIMHLCTNPATAEYLLAGELFSLYAYLFARNQGGSRHIHRVENYIRSNYMYPIRVAQMASELGLDRHYLSRLFKGETGLSIQEYLIRTRLEEAERLLLRGCSVKEAAHLTGYEDESNFSKMFKKHTGRNPSSIVDNPSHRDIITP